jgi:DNA polymerase-3 subunit alpha
MITYFGIHNHTYYSNIRLLDSINKPKDLIDTAIKLGMSGVAITDHECLSAHMEVNQYAKEIKKEHPDFKIALGNEIYLVNDRERNQKYYHFLLIAKDAIGHKALRELSSIAWQNLYVDKKMERVPTTKNELKEIVNKYPGHLIATTACIGGELSSDALMYAKAEIAEEWNLAAIYKQKIIDFIMYCKELFGEDFYIECAPSTSGDQRLVNSKLYSIAKCFDIKMVVGTDAHYLTKNDRLIHKAYLNSKEGDREVDSFYEFTYLMDSEEVDELLKLCFPDGVVDWILDNTLEVQNKIEEYSLERKQIIPKVEVLDYKKVSFLMNGTINILLSAS